MKIRVDFVTNSSSSSFVIVNTVDKTDELVEQFKDEYGKYGIRLLDTLLIPSKQLKEWLDKAEDDYFEIEIDSGSGQFWYSFDDAEVDKLKESVTENPNAFYLFAERYLKDTECGVCSNDDTWLLDHIPYDYQHEVLETEPDW